MLLPLSAVGIALAILGYYIAWALKWVYRALLRLIWRTLWTCSVVFLAIYTCLSSVYRQRVLDHLIFLLDRLIYIPCSVWIQLNLVHCFSWLEAVLQDIIAYVTACEIPVVGWLGYAGFVLVVGVLAAFLHTVLPPVAKFLVAGAIKIPRTMLGASNLASSKIVNTRLQLFGGCTVWHTGI